MNEVLVHPNFHVALIHLPLGLVVVGVIIEFIAIFFRDTPFQSAGRWMILIGAVACIPAITSGIHAMRTVISSNPHLTWMEILNDPGSRERFRPVQWDMLVDHLRFTVGGSAVLMAAVLTFVGSSDQTRRGLRWVLRLLLVVGTGLLISGAWHGGEMVYMQGAGVRAEADRSVVIPAPKPISESSTTAPSTQPILPDITPEQVRRVFPPVEVHMFLAGVLIAFALISIALSSRAITHAGEIAPGETRVFTGDPPRTTPSSRFWILTAIFSICVALSGWWLLAVSADVWRLSDLWDLVRQDSARRMAHVLAGTALLALTLILAFLARLAPRNVFFLGLVASLLVFALGIQVWLGTLLMFDTSSGPITDFNPPAKVGR